MTEIEYKNEIARLEAELQETRSRLFERSTLMMDLVLDRILRSRVDIPTFNERMYQIAGISFPSQDFVCIIVHRKSRAEKGTHSMVSLGDDRSECEYIGNCVISTLQNTLAHEGRCYCANLHDSVNILFCFDYSGYSLQERYNSILPLIDKNIQVISERMGMCFQACVSEPFQTIENVIEVYRKTYDMCTYALSTDFTDKVVITGKDVQSNTVLYIQDSISLQNFYIDMGAWEFDKAKLDFAAALNCFFRRTTGGSRLFPSFLESHLNQSFKIMLPAIPLSTQDSIIIFARKILSQRRSHQLYDTLDSTMDILNEIFTFMGEKLLPLLTEVPDRLQNIAALINRQYNNPNFSFTAIAQDLDISVSTLSRQFKQYYGITPIRYLQNTRIAAAQLLLGDPRPTIEQVSKRVGYYSQSAFVHVFKEITGMTPSAYRIANEKPKEYM